MYRTAVDFVPLQFIFVFQLVYEQDEVYNVPTSQDDLSVSGKLRIVERVSIFLSRVSCILDDIGQYPMSFLILFYYIQSKSDTGNCCSVNVLYQYSLTL